MIKLIYMLIFIFSMSAYAQEQQHIQVVTEDWPPYNYMLPDGNVGGEATELVKEVLNLTGLSYDIRLYPWLRTLEIAKNNKNALIYSILRTPERENLFKWICPISRNINIYLYALSERADLRITELNSAKKHMIGVTRGDYPHLKLLKMGFTNDDLHVSAAELANIRMLINGRVDYVVQTHHSMITVLPQLGYSTDIVTSILEVDASNAKTNCMAFNKQTSDEIVNKVRQALKIVKRQDTNTTAQIPPTKQQ